jgi:hypothetical protein
MFIEKKKKTRMKSRGKINNWNGDREPTQKSIIAKPTQ